MLYALAAKVYVASDSKKHLYYWQCRPNFIANRIGKKDILFLQHGVTALKKDDNLFGKKGSSPMTYYVTTSMFEQKIIIDNFGYSYKNAPVLGFCRWDVLESKVDPDNKIILCMPTWRVWLEDVSHDDFINSDYYIQYSNLMRSERLNKLLNENDLHLIFYIHPKFAEYLDDFKIENDRIRLVPFGSEPLNEIMMKCSLLITDYSSVCWDVYYQKKPVIFFQFDYDKYMTEHGSYIDMENELFGERYIEYDGVLDGIKESAKEGFKLNKNAEEKYDYYFEYNDNRNSERTYSFLEERHY